MLALHILALVAFLPIVTAQNAAIDTLGGNCSLPVSASACPYPCPLVAGVETCVPLLGESDDCVAARSSTDGVCDQTLVCEEGSCQGVGLKARCGSNGKACGEGLVCAEPFDRYRLQPQICVEAGGVGDGCDYSAETQSAVSGDGTELKGCAEGLSCLPPPDKGNEILESGVFTTPEMYCQERTGEGEPCLNDEWCGEPYVTGERLRCTNKKCVRPGVAGAECDEDTKLCALKTPKGEDLICVSGACVLQKPLGGTCSLESNSNACPETAVCHSISGTQGICLEAVGLGRPCDGKTTVCWREGLAVRRRSGLPFDGSARCDAGICAEDNGPGGNYQLCSDDSECAPSGRLCAEASDGQRRCLDKAIVGGPCSSSSSSWRSFGLGNWACPEGSACLVRKNAKGGFCTEDDAVVGASAKLGEECDNDVNTANGSPIQCVDSDADGNRLTCGREDARTSDQDGGTSLVRRCVRWLRNGESCAIENGVCDLALFDPVLRRASCDESNTCVVEKDLSCSADGDCDASEGESCVAIFAISGSPQQFACLKFNQQLGQECQTSSPAFTQQQTLRCAEGLECFNRFPQYRSVDGTCVKLVEIGQLCDEVNDSIVCREGACLGGKCQAV